MESQNTLLSGGNDALGPTGPDAPLEEPLVDVRQCNESVTGQRAKKHSMVDNKDILYCFLWSKQKARLCHGGYAKYMSAKWSELRADKPLSNTALATKGKRLYDRALKDLSANGWLGFDDLEKIRRKVELDFAGNSVASGGTPVESECGSENVSVGDSPSTGRPVSQDYENLLHRAKYILADIKHVPIEQQMRRRLKKRNLSSSTLNSVNWLAHDLISYLDAPERDDLSIINSVMYTVAAVTSFKDGQEFSSGPSKHGANVKQNQEPFWKLRLSRKIQVLRKEADILKAHLERKVKKPEACAFLNDVLRKFVLDGSRDGVAACLFRIKNRISALAGKIRSFELNRKIKEQNDLFQKDKKAFYRSLSEESKPISHPPTSQDIRNFWEEKIWGDGDKYAGDAEWLGELKKNYRHVKEQEWTGIREKDVTIQLAKSMNWKAPGHDCLTNYWLKSFPSLHARLSHCLNRCVERPEELPGWMVRGKTTLLAKSKNTSDASQFRPITCLTTLWKCLTGIISDKITEHLNSYEMIAIEQQGAVKFSYGTKTQLLINKSVLEDAIRRKKNLSMLYVDYSKAYDSVPHKWIIEVLGVYKVSSFIIRFLAVSMLSWRTDMFLYYDGGLIRVDNINIRRGIFQGDGLSPLLFILAINPLSLLINRRCKGYELNKMNISHILYMDDLKSFCCSLEGLKVMALLIEKFSTDIGMELQLSKCKVVNMVAGKYAKLGGVTLESGGVIEELEHNEVYKYLGIEELDGIRHAEMKGKVIDSMKKKLRKLLESELNSKNIIMAINECVLPIISYSFGVLNWLESDLKACDIQIRKLLHMHKMFELKNDVDRLYVSRKLGGRGLISVWDSFRSSVSRISHVLCNADNELLAECLAVDKMSLFSNVKRAEKFERDAAFECPANFHEKSFMVQGKIKAKLVRESLVEKHLIAWKSKPQHGAFVRRLEATPEIDLKNSFAWLSKCHMDPHSEAYILAAQELALFSRYHEKNILKNRDDDGCRVCGVEPETISHILFGCDSLAKREYLTRHNGVCKYIHHTIIKAFGISCSDNWFTHSPKDVILQKDVEVVYDQVIQTSKPIGANRPDLIVKDIANKRALIIDISCPNDINVGRKEKEKIAKYQPLGAELRKLWGVECTVVPVVIGGLGAVTKDFNDHLTKLPGCPKSFMCQKIAMLGSKRILMDVLGRK